MRKDVQGHLAQFKLLTDLGVATFRLNDILYFLFILIFRGILFLTAVVDGLWNFNEKGYIIFTLKIFRLKK